MSERILRWWSEGFALQHNTSLAVAPLLRNGLECSCTCCARNSRATEREKDSEAVEQAWVEGSTYQR